MVRQVLSQLQMPPPPQIGEGGYPAIDFSKVQEDFYPPLGEQNQGDPVPGEPMTLPGPDDYYNTSPSGMLDREDPKATDNAAELHGRWNRSPELHGRWNRSPREHSLWL